MVKIKEKKITKTIRKDYRHQIENPAESGTLALTKTGNISLSELSAGLEKDNPGVKKVYLDRVGRRYQKLKIVFEFEKGYKGEFDLSSIKEYVK